jgi:peptidylprolyl isomerase
MAPDIQGNFMRRLAVLATTLLLAACASTATTEAPEASPRYAFWRPAPVEGATEPSEVIAHSTAADWRAIEPDNLLVMDLADGGRVVIELAPDFAPVHVANVRASRARRLVERASVYRVQGQLCRPMGNGDARWRCPTASSAPRRPNMTGPRRAFRAAARLSRQLCADGRPCRRLAGRLGSGNGRAWLTHCYASVGVGRTTSPRYRHRWRALMR